MISEVFYRVILPFDLLDYSNVIIREPEASYALDNAIRRANNEAFQLGVVSLFNILTSWSAECRLSLRVETLGLEVGHEPGTKDVSAWEYFEFARRRWVVRPYRAQFLVVKCTLPRALCVDSLISDTQIIGNASSHTKSKQILPEAGCWIAQACPSLRYFCCETGSMFGRII
ncbi:hypothetical protein BDV06DRAFT_124202 [Aspergillus oleicola]